MQGSQLLVAWGSRAVLFQWKIKRFDCLLAIKSFCFVFIFFILFFIRFKIGGVFHIVFFKDMETIWKTQPSMLLARQTLILHLQHNTSFTVVTSINHFWSEEWKEYVQDQIPAFMLLTDAENIPWKTKGRTKAESVIEFLFRSLLMHCLGQGLNCVYISGIQMTATKVMGFYMESSAKHKAVLRKVSVSIIDMF